jgi:hypothetical protein
MARFSVRKLRAPLLAKGHEQIGGGEAKHIAVTEDLIVNADSVGPYEGQSGRWQQEREVWRPSFAPPATPFTPRLPVYFRSAARYERGSTDQLRRRF